MKKSLVLALAAFAFIHIADTPAMGQSSGRRHRAASQSSKRASTKQSQRQPSDAELESVAAGCNQGVLNGLIVSHDDCPEYTEQARKERASGVVVVRAYIDERGRVYYAKAISGPSSLYQPSIKTAYGTRFKPFRVEGKPVKCSGTLSYNFVWQ